MVRRKRGGRRPGQQARQRQGGHMMHEPPLVQPRQPFPQRLVPGNQRQHGRKAHLEADAHHLMRHRDHQAESRQRQPAHRHRAPPQHQPKRHQASHYKAAQDRQVPTRQQQVPATRRKAGQSGNRLARPVQRCPLPQREPKPGEAHEQPHDDADMQTGDRQQVRQSGVAERRTVGCRNGCRAARQQRGRHSAGRARQARHDACGHPVPQAVEPRRYSR